MLICAISLCQNLNVLKIRRCCYPMATTTCQFEVSFILIADDVIEEAIGYLIETGNLHSSTWILCSWSPTRTIRFRFHVLSKDKGENRQPEMVCLQDPIKPMHIPADILKMSKSTVSLGACSKSCYRGTIVL